MYITQKIAEAVKLQAKHKKISIKDLLATCELNINTISDFSRGQQISLISFARIADVLDCSVDYLLGRTNNPQAHKNVSSMSVGDVSGNNGAIGVGNTVTNNSASIDEQTEEMLNTYKKLSPLNKAKLLVYADELAKK